MGILDLTNPLVLFAAILLYAFLFILGKEFKKSSLPAIALVIFLVTLGIYGIQLATSNNAETNKLIVTCIGYNAVLVFLSYISYLWIDDIENQKTKKALIIA